MGQWYDIGLQAGSKVAQKVDEFIKAEDFKPENRKELEDGSVIYRWCMKWDPYWYKDEKKFMEMLTSFDDEYLDEDRDDDEYLATAYKLVAVGDEGGQDEEYNEAGGELFDGLYNGCSVTYPEPFVDSGDRVINKNELRTKVEAIVEAFEKYCDTLQSEDYEMFYEATNEVLALAD